MQLLAAPGLACLRGRLSSSKIARVRVATLIASSSAPRESAIETFKVPCGSAGSIAVDLYNSQILTNPSSPLVIYLPPTGSHLSSKHPPIPPYLLSSIAALATINYRWNNPSPGPSSPKPLSSNPTYNNHPFPTPLHDTLYGYQFLINSLLPRFSSPTSPQQNGKTSIYAPPRPSKQQRPILIYGSFLGGTIATSLALTESYASKSLPTRIVGLITKNAIFDWTDVATSLPPTPPTSLKRKDVDIEQDVQQDVWNIKTLHALRSHLFTTPCSAFDAFASPTQFFRTAGLVIPPTWPTEEEPKPNPPSNSNPFAASDFSDSSSPAPSASDPYLATQEASTLSRPPPSPSTASESETQSSLLKRISELQIEGPSRPAHLKFPPAASGLKIPRSLFLYTPSPTPPPPPSLGSLSSSSSSPASKSPKSSAKPRKQKKPPAEDDEGAISPAGQAKSMAALLRRSVFLHEFSDRKIWDEDLDPHTASDERAQVLGVGGEEGEHGEEEREVRRWIEECFG